MAAAKHEQLQADVQMPAMPEADAFAPCSWEFLAEIEAEEQRLKDHGLGTQPDARKLAAKACELEDGLCALAHAIGLEITKDFRGRWIVFPAPRGGGKDD